jgi:D-alanine-D-alanine ligase
MTAVRGDLTRELLLELERKLASWGPDLAVFLVYDQPQRVQERPGLARTFFAERAVPQAQLDQMSDALRAIGSHVEVLAGELPLLEALADGRLQGVERDLKVIYNGIGDGIGIGGFEPGRKSLIPAVADAYGVPCSNSSAYACALGRHKFHYFTVMEALGIRTPAVWHYRPSVGWAGGKAPPGGTKVIVKSTYEAWSVGVTEDSVFVVDEASEERVATIADQIGQAVTVQEFVAGIEVCVPVLTIPGPVVSPPVETVLTKAADDKNAVMTIADNVDGTVEYKAFAAADEVAEELRSIALNAFDVLELRAFARVDFRVDDAGTPWVTDIAVSPGLGAGSSTFRSLAELGFDYPGFIRVIIAATLGSRGLIPDRGRAAVSRRA